MAISKEKRAQWRHTLCAEEGHCYAIKLVQHADPESGRQTTVYECKHCGKRRHVTPIIEERELDDEIDLMTPNANGGSPK